MKEQIRAILQEYKDGKISEDIAIDKIDKLLASILIGPPQPGTCGACGCTH
jgi:hypothetical protein